MQFGLLAAIFTAFGLVAALPAGEEKRDEPPRDQVKFVDLKYGGTGCPAGSVEKIFSDKRDVVTLLFDKYVASTAKDGKTRLACQLNVKIHYPQGWQFGVFKADYRGHVELQQGVQAVSKATYYFSGDSKQITREHWFTGKIDEDYLRTDQIGVESTVWSPCGTEGLLNLKTSVEIKPFDTKKSGSIGVDSTDLKYTQKYWVQWRKCNK